jgi:hypothetical protein
VFNYNKQDPETSSYPNKLGFDHMESYFIGVQNPSSNMRANVNFNVLGNVAENQLMKFSTRIEDVHVQ